MNTKENRLPNTTQGKVREAITWDKVLDICDEQFPKGQCKERGNMIVVLAYAKMALDKAVNDARAQGEAQA